MATDFVNEITNEINTEFKNTQDIKNKIKITAKNSKLGSISVS